MPYFEVKFNDGSVQVMPAHDRKELERSLNNIEWIKLSSPPGPVISRIDRPFLEWCPYVLSRNDVVVLDTETTGLRGHFIELSIIDMSGRVLYDSLFQSLLPIEPKALQTHHISESVLEDQPTVKSEWGKVCSILDGKTILTYGAKFDSTIIQETAKAHGCDLHSWQYICVMGAYADYWNAPPNFGRTNAPWQKLEYACGQQGVVLPSGLVLHRAKADAIATLELIKKIAEIGADSPTYRTSQMTK